MYRQLEKRIMPLKKEFRVGVRVKYRGALYPELQGKEGVIVLIKNGGEIGIDMDEEITSFCHDASGRARMGHGFFVQEYNLEAHLEIIAPIVNWRKELKC